MRAQVFIDQTEGGFVEVSVVKHGLSSGAGHKYNAVGEAKAVLLAFGFDAGLVDQLKPYPARNPKTCSFSPLMVLTGTVIHRCALDI